MSDGVDFRAKILTKGKMVLCEKEPVNQVDITVLTTSTYNESYHFYSYKVSRYVSKNRWSLKEKQATHRFWW